MPPVWPDLKVPCRVGRLAGSKYPEYTFILLGMLAVSEDYALGRVGSTTDTTLLYSISIFIITYLPVTTIRL